MDEFGQRRYENGRAHLDFSDTGAFSLLCMEESVAVERCPVCRSGKHALFCSTCVRKEKLCDSKSGFKFSREGVLLLQARIQEKNNLEKQIGQLTLPRYHLDELKWEVDSKQRKLMESREKRDKLTMLLESKKLSIASRKSENKRQARRLSKVRSKLEMMKERIVCLVADIADGRERFSKLDSNVIGKRRRIIKELDKFIFSMQLSQTSSFEENSPVCQGIADAASHQYVKGKWAYINTTDKLSCMIVGVTIPSSGECTHLKRYLSNSRDVSTPKALELCDAVLGEWAAVGYTSQFSHNIAKILDISLPYSTSIPRLNVQAMQMSDLINYLAQLNFNIAFLSSSQGLDTSMYDPSRLIQNLYQLVQYEHLGRRGPFTVLTSSLLQSCQGQITQAFTEDQFVDRRYEEDDDWSIVTEIPQIDESDIQSMKSQPTESLASSAVNAVSSFWPFK